MGIGRGRSDGTFVRGLGRVALGEVVEVVLINDGDGAHSEGFVEGLAALIAGRAVDDERTDFSLPCPRADSVDQGAASPLPRCSGSTHISWMTQHLRSSGPAPRVVRNAVRLLAWRVGWRDRHQQRPFV